MSLVRNRTIRYGLRAMSESPSPPPRPHESVVETMLDRPVAQIARFVGRLAVTWLRGLVDPWRLGITAVDRPEKLAPPFAFLVVTLFMAGVGRRLLWAFATVPLIDDASFVDDLRVAMGEVSLMSATIVTLPCVVIVALTGRITSLLLGGRGRLDRDPIVVSACYAIGWQAGVVCVVAAGVLAIQRFDSQRTDYSSTAFQAYLVLPVVVGMLWGAMILAPSLRRRFSPRLWAAPVALTFAMIVTAPTFVASFEILGASTDLASAAQLRIQRNLDASVGDLQAEMLNLRRIEDTDRFELTVAYTSRADDVVIVPRVGKFRAPTKAQPRFTTVLRVERSTLDELPDKALVIEPGETRVAVFEVEQTTENKETKTDPFITVYHSRMPDGNYNTGEALFWRIAHERVASLPKTQK